MKGTESEAMARFVSNEAESKVDLKWFANLMLPYVDFCVQALTHYPLGLRRHEIAARLREAERVRRWLARLAQT